MSNLENDAKQAAADAKSAITAERRHLASRALQWLRGHPRLLAAVVLALALVVALLGVAGG
ncbi:MAG: hypothetical protein ACREFL_21725 [Stellaceae bacterium]